MSAESAGNIPSESLIFTLSPTLPSALWCSIGGLSVPGNEDVDIDQVIESLASPQSSQSRFSILEQLINYWHGPCQREDAYSDEELAGHCIPLPLRRWYRHGGKRRGILGGQNILIDPEKLKVGDDGQLLFYVENQGVYLWSTIAQEDDPPVWGRFNEVGDPWIMEDVKLSEFLIQACLFEATNSAPYGASAVWADQETLDRVVGPLKPVPLGAWQWPSYPSRFHAGNGAFVFSCPNGEWQGTLGYSIWIGAKSETPPSYLRGIVDDSWEYQAI